MMRSTEDKLIHIPLNTGINQAVDQRLAPTGTLSSVVNCRISGNGILRKRPGSDGIDGSVTGTSHILQGDNVDLNVEKPAFICQVQRALCVGTTFGDAFARSTKWQFQGRFSTCSPIRKRYGLVVDDTLNNGNGFGSIPPDVTVTASGYVCVASVTILGDLHFYIEDQNGVRLFYRRFPVATVSRVRLVSQTDTVLLIFQAGANLSIDKFVISSGVVTYTALIGTATLSDAFCFWDAVSFSSTKWFLVFQSAVATATVQSRNLGTIVDSTTFAVLGRAPLTIWGDSATLQLWIGFYNNPPAGSVSFIVLNMTALTVVKATTVLKVGANLGPPLFGRYRSSAVNSLNKAFYCFRQFSSLSATWVGVAFGSATAPSAPVACWNVIPISKPDNYNRVWCVTAQNTNVLTLTRSVLLRFSDETLKAPPTIELSSPNFPSPFNSGAHPFGASTWFFGGSLSATRSFAVIPIVQQQFYSDDAVVRFDVYEYATAEQFASAQALPGGTVAIVAGQPVELFGQSADTIDITGATASAFNAGASEIGFAHAPMVFGIVLSNTPSPGMVPGTRSWRVVYEWIDMYGRRHQSAPSSPVSLTTDAAHVSATLSVSTLDVSQRQAANTGLRTFLRFYRTVAGGTEYHECARTTVAFDQANGFITFIDSESDANIAQDGFLYTDGGVLDNTLAPSCRFMCRSEDRVWFGGLWSADVIQCSKLIVPDEPIQCTDDASFQVQLPAECTGLAYMDGNVVAFAASSVYLVSGDGPNDQGIGGFASPRCLTRSAGCIDYRSIVETNIGIIFQSNQGLYLLPRGFGPAQYIGAAIQAEMAPFTGLRSQVVAASAVLSATDHLARFIVASGSSSLQIGSSTVLTYDIDSGQWFKDSLPKSVAGLTSYDSLSLGAVPGTAFICSDLSTANPTPVSVESASSDNDFSLSAINQTVQTAWIHPFGLGGFGKVNAVMIAVETSGGTQDITLTVQTDTNTAQSKLWTITDADIAYRAMWLASPRECTAVQITALGECPTGQDAGFKFISITLEVEPSGGMRLLSDAEKS